MQYVTFLTSPEQEPGVWDPSAWSLPEYVLSQELAIAGGAVLTRAGLDALAPLSITDLLSGDLTAGVHVLHLLNRLLDKASGDESLGNDAFALSARWEREARRHLGFENRQNVLLADFRGHADFVPRFREAGCGVVFLRDLPTGVDVRELAHMTGAVPVRTAADAEMILSRTGRSDRPPHRREVVMWERYTEKSKQVVYFAQQEAERRGQTEIVPEYLLLGLLRDEQTVAFSVMTRRLGIDVEGLRANIERELSGSRTNGDAEFHLSPDAMRVIELAHAEARKLNNTYIGTEHLLLGLFAEGQGAARVLHETGLDAERVRAATIPTHSAE